MFSFFGSFVPSGLTGVQKPLFQMFPELVSRNDRPGKQVPIVQAKPCLGVDQIRSEP